ncbi:MAG: trehalose-6-phosphate synthase [Acidobacteriaceae bacterium]|nr:trehalose-6-phosphate synthase [Acidobacteriaceae bacterium]
MRILSWRLIVALVIGLTLVNVASSWYEVRSRKDALRSELEHTSAALAETYAVNAQLYLQAGNRDGLEHMVERSGNTGDLIGIGIYSGDGSVLAVTPALNSLLPGSPRILMDAVQANRPENNYMRLHFRRVYVLGAPLHGPNGTVIGGILMAHDTAYIRNEVFRAWGRVFVRILLQALVIVAITILIVRWSLTKPIARVADWIKALRTGQHAPPPSDMDFLLPLTREVAPLAKSIQTARGAAATEARLRNANESEWTAQRLAAHVRSRLEGSSLFVVANREPYIHNWRDGSIQVSVPASGLVAAIEPILCACNGTWVAHGSGNADMEVTDEHDRLQVPPEEPLYTLRRIWLSAEEEDGYYYGFANEGLWPLCHNAHTRPIFRASDWDHYYNVNQKFADVLVEEIGAEEHPVVLIQDYHFALLPRMVKNRLPHARIAIFWHIPWPTPESFEICPWQRELLDGLLGADLIGFHVRAHCNNFLNTVDHVLEARIDWEHFSVRRNDHISLVLPFPISVECCDDISPRPATDVPDERRAVLKEAGVEATYIGVGVDRIDYTKGIVERFQAVESFLERYPSYQGKFTFFQLGAPTRTHIKRYADFQAEVEAEANRINARFKRGRWSPIVLQVRQHSKQEVQRYYRIAHLCMVTSLHDGMNLVAKEFVAARQDERGILILSRFTGAARELRDAIIVNPYDIEATGEAIAQALRMDVNEMSERMRRMRNTIREHNIYWWASSLIGTLCEVRLDQAEPAVVPANDRVAVET